MRCSDPLLRRRARHYSLVVLHWSTGVLQAQHGCGTREPKRPCRLLAGSGLRLSFPPASTQVGKWWLLGAKAASCSSGMSEPLDQCKHTTTLHTEDLVRVRFQPGAPTRLLSAGDDGLISIIDVTIADVDDALVDCLSVGSGIDRFGFFGHTPEDSGVWVCCSDQRFELCRWLRRQQKWTCCQRAHHG